MSRPVLLRMKKYSNLSFSFSIMLISFYQTWHSFIISSDTSIILYTHFFIFFKKKKNFSVSLTFLPLSVFRSQRFYLFTKISYNWFYLISYSCMNNSKAFFLLLLFRRLFISFLSENRVLQRIFIMLLLFFW